MPMKIQNLKCHSMHSVAYRPWHLSKNWNCFEEWSEEKGPNTALWTTPDILGLHLLGLEYLKLLRTSRETEMAATLLVSVGETETQNTNFLG